MHKFYFLLFFICFSFYSYAQIGSLSSAYNDPAKIIPPSPNAAALEKFTTVPVDFSTGVPAISYPIWSWQRNRLNFNLGLAYHAGGNKVNDMASNVGLGWALNGLSRITRTVKGLPDDMPVSGFMYANILPPVGTDFYDGDYYHTQSAPSTTYLASLNAQTAINPYNSSYYTQVKEVLDNTRDGEQDIFSYSIAGSSGRFIIDHDKKIIPLENSNIKFEILNASSTSSISGFKLTDDKGIVYTFDFLEYQYSEPISSEDNVQAGIPGAVSSWLLTKQEDPLTLDAITIIYANSQNGCQRGYETGFNESEAYELEEFDRNSLQKWVHLQKLSDVINYLHITSDDPQPTIINFPDGSKINFSYDHPRQDFNNTKALTGITIKNDKDNVVKNFELNYSYFNSFVGNFDYTFFINDNTKRLRLDGIDELSNDGQLRKPTNYSYNSILLNSRGSRNCDYWGYNVNPARNNGQYLPLIPFEQKEIDILKQAGNITSYFLDGADIKPDENYVKAGILERITYPTGGFTDFEFECNRAFSPVDYYIDKLPTNSLEWQASSFGQNPFIYMPGRTKNEVEFLFKTEEFEERTAQNQQSCIDDIQDLSAATFIITSTDNAVSFTFTDVYSHFLGNGQKRVFDLPVDKTYRVKFDYDISPQCAFLYEFKATAKCTYYIVPVDKPAGGLRIKKILTNDGQGNTLTKEYNYNNPDGRSSAVLNEIPSYGYHRTLRASSYTFNPTPGITETINYDIMGINRTSSPTNTINYFNASPLIYSRVNEVELNGSSTERQYDPFVSTPTGGTNFYPLMPTIDLPNLSGLLTHQLIKDNLGAVKSETINTYDKNILQLQNSNNRNFKSGIVATGYSFNFYVGNQYYLSTSRALQNSSITSVYEAGNILTQTVNKTYDPFKFYLHSETSTNSKNENRTSEYLYATDKVGSVYTAMLNNNMFNYLVGSSTYVPFTLNSQLANSTVNYALFPPNNIPAPSTVQSSFLDNPLVTEMTFNAYDDKNNLLEYTGKDGVVQTIIWGYKKQYPVAKITGKTYSDAVSQSNIDLNILNNPTDDVVMRTELAKLRNLSSCIVTTITYKPLVGITSETDPNGRSKFYEYDNFNRLNLIRDQDNKILKRLCYNYAGQPEDCSAAINTNPIWTSTGSTRCQACPSNISYLSGVQEKEEKDNNPNSPGYNNTRWVTDYSAYCPVTADYQSRPDLNFCEQVNGQNSGTLVTPTVDMNPCSDTYNQNGTPVLTPNSFECANLVCVGCRSPQNKCINGVCRPGTWTILASVRTDVNTWTCYWGWCYPDGSSTNVSTTTSSSMCAIGCF